MMARVVAIRDARTITVQRGSRQADITLAGVEPNDRLHSTEFLRWTLAESWITLEACPEEGGAFYVYRSPDGLFVNREYVMRGYANATLPAVVPAPQTPVVYLGIVDPGKRKMTEARSTREGAIPPPKAPAAPRPRSRRGGR